MLRKQKGKCLLCDTTAPNDKRLVIDHDHRTGKVRGLLCSQCNLRLGVLEGLLFAEANMRTWIHFALGYLENSGTKVTDMITDKGRLHDWVNTEAKYGKIADRTIAGYVAQATPHIVSRMVTSVTKPKGIRKLSPSEIHARLRMPPIISQLEVK